MYRSYWIPEMNDTPPNKLGRLTAWRGQAFPIGGLMRWSLDLPPERLKNAMEGKMRMSAERYSMDQRDFKAVKQTIDAAVKYFKDGKSLNFTSIKVDELDSLWPDGVTAMEQLTDLVHCEDDTKVRRRFYQAFGIEILEKALKQKGNGNPTARDIEQLLGTDKYKALRDTISSAATARRLLVFLDTLRNNQYNIIYLFRSASLNWCFAEETKKISKKLSRSWRYSELTWKTFSTFHSSPKKPQCLHDSKSSSRLQIFQDQKMNGSPSVKRIGTLSKRLGIIRVPSGFRSTSRTRMMRRYFG